MLCLVWGVHAVTWLARGQVQGARVAPCIVPPKRRSGAVIFQDFEGGWKTIGEISLILSWRNNIKLAINNTREPDSTFAAFVLVLGLVLATPYSHGIEDIQVPVVPYGILHTCRPLNNEGPQCTNRNNFLWWSCALALFSRYPKSMNEKFQSSPPSLFGLGFLSSVALVIGHQFDNGHHACSQPSPIPDSNFAVLEKICLLQRYSIIDSFGSLYLLWRYTSVTSLTAWMQGIARWVWFGEHMADCRTNA